jgi:hypothetical protein
LLSLLRWFRVFTALLLAVGLSSPAARAGECNAARTDQDLAVYLVTTGPGDSLFSLMGHSALWVSGAGREAQIYNWGAFDSTQEDFVWKFLEGTLDYELDLESFGKTRRRATEGGRPMVAQRLDLPPEAETRLLAALDENALPENRPYLYHWHLDNCATRVRDVLDHALNGGLQYLADEPRDYTIRDEVLRHLGPALPSWAGWHFMASNYAEQSYDGWSELHIPVRLMERLDEVQIEWSDGETRPLVPKRCTKVEGVHDWAPEDRPDRSLALWSIGIAWGGLIALAGSRRNRWLRGLSATGMTLYVLVPGITGSVILFLSLASRMEGFGPNENWFHASPLSLLLLPAAWSWFRESARQPLWTRITLGLAGLSTLGLLLDPFLSQHNGDLIGLMWPPLVASAWVMYYRP